MLRQWIFAALAVSGAFFIAGIGGSFVTHILGYWDLPGAGFCAAMAVVLTTYIVAPSHKLVLSGCAFLMGALVAWRFLEPSWYPETYEKLAYQDTHLPLIATYAGGLIGLAITGLVSRWPRLRSLSSGAMRSMVILATAMLMSSWTSTAVASMAHERCGRSPDEWKVFKPTRAVKTQVLALVSTDYPGKLYWFLSGTDKLLLCRATRLDLDETYCRASYTYWEFVQHNGVWQRDPSVIQTISSCSYHP